jgi:hypothetical protein
MVVTMVKPNWILADYAGNVSRLDFTCMNLD